MLYAIRHKTTGQYLSPGPGASYWEGEGGVAPRLFHTLHAAKSFQSSWVRGEVFTTEYYDYETGHTEIGALRIKDKGRNKAMIEIVPVTLTFEEPL